MYFDSHAHYYDERFSAEWGEDVDARIAELFEDSVSGIVNVGTNPENSRTVLLMARRFPKMYAAVGIHPSDTAYIADLDRALYEIESLLASHDPKVVAIGEIGLDYHYENTDKEKQEYAFRAQLAMARSYGMPFVVHDRDAHGDTVRILGDYTGITGVLHSYSGSAEMLREICAMGHMISYSGTVSFKNARKVYEAAAATPLDRVMIETDCPYLAPHPLRGSMNHSGNLVYTNRALASALGIDECECARITEENALRFFNLKS